MAKRITVVLSQGQSASPAKRGLEEELVARFMMERGLDVTVIPHLYDLAPDGTGMLCLQGISGDMVVLSWLFPRAAHWVLARNGVAGQTGTTLLVAAAEEEDDEDDVEDKVPDASPDAAPGASAKAVPNRKIYCIDLRVSDQPQAFVDEVLRIARESTVQTVDLLGWIGGNPSEASLARFVTPANGNVEAANGAAPPPVVRIDEPTDRRWYPVIDYSRCTNCMECLDFCLFGVYGLDRADAILVEQPDNCRKGCPACSRVCPENAIIFPQHKTPASAGSADGVAGGFKIDLSRLFGAPDALQQAVVERDTELVAVGRDAVGEAVGMPKRQADRCDGPKDELDQLIDQLDDLAMPPLPLCAINHVARQTRRLEASRSFYRDLLGFREIERPAFNFRGAWLFGYGVQLHLIEDQGAPDPHGEIQTRADHLAFDTSDLAQVERTLAAMGVPFRVNVQSGTGVRQLFLRDPDGHHVEIAAYPATPAFLA
jgi:catechol 2,3-dioxygenase-like lactoylglutathione lyase family enzyme/NAD-dependent dihydropyrimidine dehydrogenase PreA subunit